jgi:hypothetical protein
MKKVIILLIIGLSSYQGFAQANQMTINYELSKSTGLEQVGGDLVVGGNNFCLSKNNNKQVLFNASSHSTVFLNIGNTGGGNSCVTLVVETVTGIIKTEIPEDSQTGILKFNKVRNAYLIISRRPIDGTIETATSIGVATIWF